MGYTLCFCEKFQYDVMSLPKNVQKKVVKTIQPFLRENPSYGPEIKKLKGFKNLWRYKIDNGYRLIYSIEEDSVTLLKAGPRKNVYESLHYAPEKGPTIVAVAKVPDILDPIPTAEEHNTAVAKIQIGGKNKKIETFLDKPEIKEILQNTFPDDYYQELKQCASGEGFIHTSIPANKKQLILNVINPPTIAEIKNSPIRVLQNDNDLLSLIEGEITLDSLLLRLDSEQKSFVNKFKDKTSLGPWLLKGGPGTGKTIISLYCIKEIIDPVQQRLTFNEKRTILFTTFTNSLVKTGAYLLKQLSGEKTTEVQFQTLSSMATTILKESGKRLWVADDGLKRGMYYTLIKANKIDPRKTGFDEADWNFIDEEIEWVIYANNIKTIDEYLQFNRAGRGKILGKEQRKNLWHIFEIYDRELIAKERTTSRKLFIEALECLNGQYGKFDYVFLDEAQDLPAIAVKFALKLCKNPQHLFVTADMNQCIYGKGISWKSIDQELNFQGRTTQLIKNYRLPKEIMTALKILTKDLSHSDPETLVNTCVYSSQPPALAFCNDFDQELITITDFIKKSLLELRLTHEAVAILCPNNRLAQDLASKLPIEFNAKHLQTKSRIMEHNGVKVLTIHAAKGLQFPIVIIPRLTKDTFPPKAPKGIDIEEFDQKQRRTFFVACTRTIKKLLVTTISGQESDYLKYMPETDWEHIKKLGNQ